MVTNDINTTPAVTTTTIRSLLNGHDHKTTIINPVAGSHHDNTFQLPSSSLNKTIMMNKNSDCNSGCGGSSIGKDSTTTTTLKTTTERKRIKVKRKQQPTLINSSTTRQTIKSSEEDEEATVNTFIPSSNTLNITSLPLPLSPTIGLNNNREETKKEKKKKEKKKKTEKNPPLNSNTIVDSTISTKSNQKIVKSQRKKLYRKVEIEQEEEKQQMDVESQKSHQNLKVAPQLSTTTINKEENQKENKTKVKRREGVKVDQNESSLPVMNSQNGRNLNRPMRGKLRIPQTTHIVPQNNYQQATPSPVPIQTMNNTLPIHEFSSSIINAIEENQVTVITGFTGCGKSTQLPQIILKHFIENSTLQRLRKTKIVCTQPRRLAATSLARRVNNEMKNYLNNSEMNQLFKGRVAGHIIGGESDLDSTTPIVYATEGCLTQIIMGMHSSSSSTYEKFHKEFSHIVLDEIHERKVDTDLLLYFVREIVRVNPKIRIILMSATLSQEKICKYFETYLNLDLKQLKENEEDEFFVSTIEKKVPSIHIPSGCYPVAENHIEDVIHLLYNSSSNPLPEKELLNKPQFSALLSKPLRATIKPERRVLGARLIEYLHTHYPLNQSILVFLPGMMEIEDFSDEITANFIGGAASVDCPYDIHILHSLIAEQEQEESLLPPKEGKRKIILSTNIAESSITVPDVVIVIDFCLCKGKYWNENFNAEVMGLDWISKDSGKQRKGRAGRVSPGILYRMITREEFELLDDSVVPEIQRKPLSSVVLQILMFNGAYRDYSKEFKGLPKNYKTPSEVLQKCLDPPNQNLLEQAYIQLESLGAIVNYHFENNKNDSELNSVINQYELDEAFLVTNIGKFFSQIPTELNAAYLLLIGYSLNLLPECIIIVSILSRSVPILAFSSLKLLTARALYSFDNGSESDLISGFNAYNRFKHLQSLKREQKITPREFSSTIASEMIALKKMIEIDSLVLQISQALYRSYGIFIDNITPNTVKHTKQALKHIHFSTNQVLDTGKMNTIKALIATLYYEQAIKGTLKKEHPSIHEIECSLQIRNQKLSITNQNEMKMVFTELFKKFDGGIVNCKTIKFQNEKKINISYSLPVSDTSFVIPYTESQKKDPLFPIKMLQRIVKGTSQESKEKNIQILDYSQVRQSMLSVRDDDQIYGIFRGLPGDLVKSHGLKFKSVSTAFDRKISFIHPQSDTFSKQRIIISRDSVSHPWVDLVIKDKILIPGGVSIRDMVMVLDKNTTLPNIESFYEMSLLLFLPLIYPRRFSHFKSTDNDFFLISELFQKMKPQEKTEFIQNKINTDLSMIYLISSSVKNFDLVLQEVRETIQKKINELLSCQSIFDVGTLSTQVTDLLNNAKNFISHKGYNRNISKIVSLSPVEDIDGGEDDESCGANILRTASFQRISQRILNLLAKQCLLTPDDPPVEIKKRGKTTVEISCSFEYQYLQAKYLLLREINNDFAVFAHPKQAFVCLEIEKGEVEKFLTSKVYFSYHEDKSGKNREFYTINRIPETKKPERVDESREHNSARKALTIKIKSDKLTNGGFLLEPYTIKPAIDVFREKVSDCNDDEYMQLYAYFGKQVFYQSKAGATKIHSQQKGLSFSALRKMKIGNDNDIKTLFLHFIDSRRQTDDSLISKFLSSMNGDVKESVFSSNRYFKPVISDQNIILGKQKEYISLNIVDMEKRERFTILLYLNREQNYVDEDKSLVKCNVMNWRRSDTKLIYLDFISPIIVQPTDDSELITRKNENTIDVRFAKVTHSKTIKNGYRDLLPSSILELEDSLWYDESNFTLYYCHEKDGSVSFANLNDLNLSFGSTMENDELCELRKKTPLSRLSIDSIHYDIKENLHIDLDLKIQFKNRTDISHPTQRKSFTTLRVCHRQLKASPSSRFQKPKVKEFMKMILLWKNVMNENSLKLEDQE